MPTRQTTTSAARKELGELLRRLRIRRGMTGVQVAEATGIDPGTLSRYENGRRKVELLIVKTLLDLYGADESGHRAAVAFWEADAKTEAKPSWWRRGFTVPEDFGQYLAEEQEARLIRSVEPHLPPGRLQTEEVAAAVIAGLRPDLSAEAVTGLVDLRMRRQAETLEADQEILLGSTVLDLPGLSAGSAILQLERLLEGSQQPGMRIRVLPAGLSYNPALAAPFVLMVPPVGRTSAWVELMDRSIRLPDAAVERYQAAFSVTASHALSPSATQDHLAQLIKDRK
ncbi:helix-turn-helix transcriptional regulator [Kitasatospora sp. NPDC088779]|uniref:helix-turn-helix domain-containing protein n=1 Tax=unclassified Kitasatospora TaxID=2633591 RepID=UPI003442D3A2